MNKRTLFLILSAALPLVLSIPSTISSYPTPSASYQTHSVVSSIESASLSTLSLVEDSNQQTTIQQECLICLEEMQVAELYPSFECSHHDIHKACFDRYIQLSEDNASCPYCRAPLVDLNVNHPFVIGNAVSIRTIRGHRTTRHGHRHNIERVNECNSVTEFQELKAEFILSIHNTSAEFSMEIFNLCSFTVDDTVEFINLASSSDNWSAALKLLARLRKAYFRDLLLSFDKAMLLEPRKKQSVIKQQLSATDRPFNVQLREAHYECLERKDSVCNAAFLEWYTTSHNLHTTPDLPSIDDLIQVMITETNFNHEKWISAVSLFNLPRSIISLDTASLILEAYSSNKDNLDDVLKAMSNVCHTRDGFLMIVVWMLY